MRSFKGSTGSDPLSSIGFEWSTPSSEVRRPDASKSIPLFRRSAQQRVQRRPDPKPYIEPVPKVDAGQALPGLAHRGPDCHVAATAGLPGVTA